MKGKKKMKNEKKETNQKYMGSLYYKEKDPTTESGQNLPPKRKKNRIFFIYFTPVCLDV